MENKIPKPGPFIPSKPKPLSPAAAELSNRIRNLAEDIKETPEKKTKFIPKPHLTDRPFAHDPALQDLNNELHTSEN